MKIDSSFKTTAPLLTPRQPAPPGGNTLSTQDAVSFSQLAGALQGNEKPPVNSVKIQEIKQAISEGRFQINPGVIADRLIESARDFVERNSQREA